MNEETRYPAAFESSETGLGIQASRRQSERHAAAEDQAWIGWWEGRIYRKSLATFLDISHGGTKLVAQVAPPRCAPIWVCVAGKHQTEWVEGEVLEVTRQADGTAAVRVKFRELCPYAFFEVVVYGLPSGTDETDWSRESRRHKSAF